VQYAAQSMLSLIHTRSLSQADKLRTVGLRFPENASLVFPTFTWMYHRGFGALEVVGMRRCTISYPAYRLTDNLQSLPL
jgi:hypothetical protein